MVGLKIKSLFLILFLCLLGCKSEMDEQSAEFVDLLTAFDFESGNQDWTGGISDYPVGYEADIDYSFRNIQSASNSPIEGNGLIIHADNPHEDLFYFFKRKVLGLEPNSKYKLDFEFLVSTQLITTESISSSDELYLKIGAVNYEPDSMHIKTSNSVDYITLNVDKGTTNSEGGKDLINIGSVIEFTKATQEVISGNTFEYDIEVTSDKDGIIWIIIGVDSGIKNELAFGLEAVTIYYRKQN